MEESRAESAMTSTESSMGLETQKYSIRRRGESRESKKTESESYRMPDVAFDLVDRPESTESASANGPQFEKIMIFHGNPIKRGNDVVQAHVATPVESLEEVESVLDNLQSDEKLGSAQHHIYAFRISLPLMGLMLEEKGDNGDVGAGDKLLFLLQRLHVRNCLCVVTRWTSPNGVPSLQRFPHIVLAAKELLMKCEVVPLRDEPTWHGTATEATPRPRENTETKPMTAQSRVMTANTGNSWTTGPPQTAQSWESNSFAAMPTDFNSYGNKINVNQQEDVFESDSDESHDSLLQTDYYTNLIPKKVTEFEEARFNLKRAHLTEIRSFHRPHVTIQKVCECIAILIGIQWRRWLDLKAMVSHAGLYDFLFYFDPETLKQEQVDHLKQYLEEPGFDPEAVTTSSTAAAELLTWIRTLVAYYDVVVCNVRPEDLPKFALDSRPLELELDLGGNDHEKPRTQQSTHSSTGFASTRLGTARTTASKPQTARLRQSTETPHRARINPLKTDSIEDILNARVELASRKHQEEQDAAQAMKLMTVAKGGGLPRASSSKSLEPSNDSTPVPGSRDSRSLSGRRTHRRMMPLGESRVGGDVTPLSSPRRKGQDSLEKSRKEAVTLATPKFLENLKKETFSLSRRDIKPYTDRPQSVSKRAQHRYRHKRNDAMDMPKLKSELNFQSCWKSRIEWEREFMQGPSTAR